MRIVKILTWILFVFLLIQWIPINKVNPPIKDSKTFEWVEKPPVEITKLIENSCNDCHSYKTKFPNYTQIAPISWMVKNNVSEGREHLNFSLWKDYNPDLKKSILKKIPEVLQVGSMPKRSYILFHKEAELSTEQRSMLINYFKKLDPAYN